MTIEAPRSWLSQIELALPPGYYLERDPDLLILREGREGRYEAAFSARGATPSEVMRTAEDDYHATPNSALHRAPKLPRHLIR